MERRLSALLVADIVGYSAMMEGDDDRALKLVKQSRSDDVEPAVRRAKGRIFKYTGDGVLASFDSARAAVDAAMAIVSSSRGAEVEWRIAVALGDVIVDDDGDLYGSGVNLAARMEKLAKPGGVCISSPVYDTLAPATREQFLDSGSHFLKGMERAVQVWTTLPIPDHGGEAGPQALPVDIGLLGGFRLTVDGGARPLTSAKARVLLARLALSPTGSLHRSVLAGLLWENVPEDQARANLRQCLLQVRKALDNRADALTAEADLIGLDRSVVGTDVARLEQRIAGGEVLPEALSLLRGELLEGMSLRESAAADWIASERQRIRKLETDLLETVSETSFGAGDLAVAAMATMKALSLEPCSESLHRRMMRIHVARGEPSMAVRQFNTCRDVLRRELDVAPDAETLALLRQIQAGRMVASEPAGGPVPVTPEPEQSIHVVPEKTDPPTTTVRLRSELRQVTLLCLVCDDPDDPEDFASARIGLQDAIDEAASSGRGLRIVSDEFDLLVAFGIKDPREDDAERARVLADSLLSRIEGARVGIASGRVLVDPDNPQSLSGEVRRRAARLAVTADPGSVVCDGPSAESSRRNAGEPTGQRDVLRPQPPFVGHVFECRQIEAVIEAARQGHGGALVLLSGEAGIGKTRLSQECIRDFEASGGRTALVGFSSFSGNKVPFAHRLARRISSDVPPAPVQAATARTSIRANLLGQQQVEGGEAMIAAMDPKRRDRLIAEEICALLDEGSDMGTLIVVEDTHWATADELRLILALVTRLDETGAILIATERPQEARLAPLLQAEAAGARVLSMDLKALSRNDAEKLAQAIRPDNPPLVEATIERSGGNTLFLVRMLEGGLDDPDHLPPSIISLVQEQTARLPEDQRNTLKFASILGSRFYVQDFLDVFGEVDFEPLRAAGFLSPYMDRLTFSHALLHEAVYGSIPRADRKSLHGRVSAHFRASDPVLWAEHGLLGGSADVGEACVAASDMVLVRYELARGEQFINAGLAASHDDETHALLLFNRGSLKRERGDLEGALADYTEAAERGETNETKARNLLRIAWVRRLIGIFDGPDGFLAQASALPQETLSRDCRSEIDHEYGNQAFALNDPQASLAHHTSALDLADTALSRGRALGGIGDAHYSTGRFRTARGHFRSCVDLARQVGLGPVELGNAHMEAHCVYFSEPGEEAFALLDRALERAVDAGNQRIEFIVRVARICYLALDLRHERCRVELEAIAGLNELIGPSRFGAERDFAHALTLYCRSETEQPAQILRQSLRTVNEDERGRIEAALHGLLACTTDDASEREQSLESGAALIRDGVRARSAFWFHQFAGDALLAVGEVDRAAAHADRLDAMTREEPLGWVDLTSRRLRVLCRLRVDPLDADAIGEARDLVTALEAGCLRQALLAVREAVG